MSSQVKGAFTVRYIRTGDQIYVTKNVVKMDAAGAESGAALFQAVDPQSGSLSVDWKNTPTEQPSLKISVKSAVGNTVTITDVAWTYRGAALTFNASTETSGTYKGWNLSTDGMFAKKASGGYAYLRFIDNAASKNVISNQTIGYTLTYITNSITDTVSGTEDVIIQQAGNNSYSVTITTACSTLNYDTTQTTLTATYLYGTSAISDDDFNSGWKLVWYKDFAEISGQTGKTLTVTRDMVDGSSVFSVKLMHKEGDNWVVKAVDAQRVADDADEWQISADPTGTNPDAISLTNNAVYALTLKKNGAAYSGTATWAWTVYNALSAVTGSGTGATVTLTANMARCQPDSADTGKDYYSDVSVEVSVEI